MLKVIWRITHNVRAIDMIYPTKSFFTGPSLLEMYLYISFMLCMLPSANRPFEDQCEDIFLPVYGIYHILLKFQHA